MRHLLVRFVRYLPKRLDTENKHRLLLDLLDTLTTLVYANRDTFFRAFSPRTLPQGSAAALEIEQMSEFSMRREDTMVSLVDHLTSILQADMFDGKQVRSRGRVWRAARWSLTATAAKVCETVLRCLTALFSASPDFKALFGREFGVRSLQKRILQPDKDVSVEPWEGLVTAWLGLIVEGTFGSTQRHRVMNPAATVCLLETVPLMPDELQERTLVSCAQLADMCDLNKHHFCASGSVAVLLQVRILGLADAPRAHAFYASQLLPSATTMSRVRLICRLLQTLGSYSIGCTLALFRMISFFVSP